jgi:hypothetical protein
VKKDLVQEKREKYKEKKREKNCKTKRERNKSFVAALFFLAGI